MDKKLYEELSGGVQVDPEKRKKVRLRYKPRAGGWTANRDRNRELGRDTTRGGMPWPPQGPMLGLRGNIVLGGGPLKGEELRPNGLKRFGTYGRSISDR